MSFTASKMRSRGALCAGMIALLGATMLTAPAHAQNAPQEAPSQNAMVNLIRGLVAKGVFNAEEGQAMIAQAEAEASQARALAAAPAPAVAEAGTSVRYVPKFVRDEIKAEVRQEILAEAQTKGLVAPDAVPGWVRRFEMVGDLRVRADARFFDKRNGYDFVNVGAINAGAPYDPVNNPNLPPIVNSIRNRSALRLRARLGFNVNVDPSLTAHVALATGDDSEPVSTNQVLGGYLSKKDIWLDRAYVDYRPVPGAHILAGRMVNPFQLSELVWDEDINLDGVAATYSSNFGSAFYASVGGGAFPLDFVPDSFPDAEFADGKLRSTNNDKWLYAGQVGVGYKSGSTAGRVLASYYNFDNVAGDLSPSCFNTAAFCLTDATRPRFLQKGNTLFGLRDLVSADPNNPSAPQYFGLAADFRVLAVSAEVETDVAPGIRVNLAGHWARNLGYSEKRLLRRAGGDYGTNDLGNIVNNNERCSVDLVAEQCPIGKAIFDSGSDAWMARLTVGNRRIEKFGDWELSGTYRRIEPDALLDAFTDSDFRLGGTNSKGWTIEGSLGLLNNTFVTMRWLNAEELSGVPFRVDLLQADLNVRF